MKHFCTPGCTYTTSSEKTLKKVLETGHFIFTKTYYTKKKWWQFWKRKKPIAYEVMCIK